LKGVNKVSKNTLNKDQVSQDDLDILCFGAHPDDVEIGMAGTIRKHVELGFKVGICDLTMAELSSNGTVTKRQEEAEKAAEILGVTERINLGFPDRGLEMNRDVLATIVSVIREYKPTVVFIPYEDDRHPDHGMTSKMIEEAIFTATIRKYQWGGDQEEEPHRVTQVYYYFINGFSKPQVIVDITKCFDVKRKALLAYESQFNEMEGGVQTRLNTGFLDVIEGRDKLFGKMLDVTYAEGFMVKEPILISHLIPDSVKGE
jgi:bacillithiol biosynthesis deacetylase BshB1